MRDGMRSIIKADLSIIPESTTGLALEIFLRKWHTSNLKSLPKSALKSNQRKVFNKISTCSSHILAKFNRACLVISDYDSDYVSNHAADCSSHIEESIVIIKSKWSELGKPRYKNDTLSNQFEDTVNAGLVMFQLHATMATHENEIIVKFV